MNTPVHSRTSWPLLLPVLASLAALPVSAELVTLEFGGQVTSIFNPLGAVSGSLIQTGDPVRLSIRYDTSTPDHRPDANWGGYQSPGWLRVNIRDLTFEQANGVLVEVMNGANGNQHMFQATADGVMTAWPAALAGFSDPRLFVGIWETQAPIDLLSSAALPTALDVTRADMAVGEVSVSSGNLNAYTVQFQISPIPEPTVGRLLLWGGLIAGWHVRRRHPGRG